MPGHVEVDFHHHIHLHDTPDGLLHRFFTRIIHLMTQAQDNADAQVAALNTKIDAVAADVQTLINRPAPNPNPEPPVTIDLAPAMAKLDTLDAKVQAALAPTPPANPITVPIDRLSSAVTTVIGTGVDVAKIKPLTDLEAASASRAITTDDLEAAILASNALGADPSSNLQAAIDLHTALLAGN